MVTRTVVGILLALFVGSGCATYQVSGIPFDDQRSVYRDGRRAIISQKESTTVAVAVKEETISKSDRLEFIVAVNNLTSEELTFSTENISAITTNVASTESPELHVYTYDELVAEEKSRQFWQAIAVGLGGAADSYSAASAGYSNTYGTYDTSYDTYGTYSGTTYDYAAAQAAQNAANAKMTAEMTRVELEGKAALAELSSTILKLHTVFPGEWYGGTIQVDAPSGKAPESQVGLNISFGEDSHEFCFSRVKVQ